jgi:DNA topoisomerase-3
MLQLVEHFGDENDAGGPCGQCDVCAPDGCVALVHRRPNATERDAAERVLRALSERGGQTVGQIHRELFPSGDFDRRSLEHVLAGLVRASALRLEDDSFVKDGAVITFQRAWLAGGTNHEAARERAARFTVAGEGSPAGRRRKKDRGKGREKRKRERVRAGAGAGAATGDASSAGGLFEALRAWRLAEAKRSGVPAFRILNDRTLLGVATETPHDEGALLRVAGIGPGLARRYGAALLGIVAHYESTSR